MAMSTCADLLQSANGQIAGFLERAASLLPRPEEPWTGLPQIQSELAGLFATIARVRRELGESSPALAAQAEGQLAAYAKNLERLRDFITTLQQAAGERRNRITAGAQKVNEALAWCRTLKLTALK